MQRAVVVTGLCAVALFGCHPAMRTGGVPADADVRLAQVFYWKARPGKLDEYNRYIKEVAEPIDADAQRHGAFIRVTTMVVRDTLSPYTHMRVFMLRDSAQLAGLSAALDAAGTRLEPDSVKRRVRGEYAATLRDRVGSAVLDVLR